MNQGHQGPSMGQENKQLPPIFSVCCQWVTAFRDQLLVIINNKLNRIGQAWVALWVQYHYTYSLWKVLSLLATWSLWARI